MIRLLLVLSSSCLPALAQQADFASRLQSASSDGLSAEELAPLAAEALQRAETAPSRSLTWRALTELAQLCREGPLEAVRPLRRRALELLVERESETHRWSSLLSESFRPPFERIERELWSRELGEYDRLLVELHERAESRRVKAELLGARIRCRVFIDRRWDWLSSEERTLALELLDRLEREAGDLPVAGTNEPETDTLGARAVRLRYELTALAFGAPAPPTAGTDLLGQPLDLTELRGNVVVLDFWTTFCQPCLALVPEARRILTALAGEPVIYVGVNGDTDRAQAGATAERVGMPWRNLWDGPLGTEGPASKAWCVEEVGWPSVFVLDRAGRIRAKLRGGPEVERELESVLRALLSER